MSLSDVKICPLHLEFLLPYLEPYIHLVTQPEEADFILAMNSTTPGALETLRQIHNYGKPIAWWTIEDPNSFETFLPQAAQADVVFTSDEACIPRYHQALGHQRVFWLPLACSPQHHYPAALLESASDFVLSANWYANEARLWCVNTVVEPLCDAGYSLTLFCYESFMWPTKYRRYWQGATSCRTVADQYRHGRVVLGLNNQRSGMDGFSHTVMTSMRTFEALACGKPFLSAYSEAYTRLGFVQGVHMVWAENQQETRYWAKRLLGHEGERMAEAGRTYVLAHHTYAQRLERIAGMVMP